ncbi:MAG: hypothetical protein VB122_00065 [Erysipelotrichales bacterium]|nr:hypothetical protein [Erysipelotrichales bacterium]
MKISVLVIVQFILSVSLYAQKDVTQFLGIPVDGNKYEMINKLRDKGYVANPDDKNLLDGKFNGTEVTIYVATNNNKVWRIMVSDVNPISEIDIKIRFNKLCQQFQNNEKYISASLSNSDFSIPEDENISYEISVNKRRYEASFFQKPLELDTTAMKKELQDILLKKYTNEQLSNPTEEEYKDMVMTGTSFMYEKFSKKSVWFMIKELYGKYFIIMYYDNEYNSANGEDL